MNVLGEAVSLRATEQAAHVVGQTDFVEPGQALYASHGHFVQALPRHCRHVGCVVMGSSGPSSKCACLSGSWMHTLDHSSEANQMPETRWIRPPCRRRLSLSCTAVGLYDDLDELIHARLLVGRQRNVEGRGGRCVAVVVRTDAKPVT